jgi:hypothetical protein
MLRSLALQDENQTGWNRLRVYDQIGEQSEVNELVENFLARVV